MYHALRSAAITRSGGKVTITSVPMRSLDLSVKVPLCRSIRLLAIGSRDSRSKRSLRCCRRPWHSRPRVRFRPFFKEFHYYLQHFRRP